MERKSIRSKCVHFPNFIQFFRDFSRCCGTRIRAEMSSGRSRRDDRKRGGGGGGGSGGSGGGGGRNRYRYAFDFMCLLVDAF